MGTTSTLKWQHIAAPPKHRCTHVGASFGKIVWVFTVMSIVGLFGETLQHWVAFGEWQHRAGFIWGPFSPIYGLAAILMTWCLEPLQKRPTLLLLLVGSIIGGSLEYFASWAMETFGGIVAWSYLDQPLNFDGRTDVFHMLVWGTLGVLWVRLGLPATEWVFKRVNTQALAYKALTVLLALFMIANAFMTIAVLKRADARVYDIPAQNAFEAYCDEAYPTEMLRERFENMGGLGIE